MDAEIQHLHKDIEDIKQNIEFIKNILAEDYELTDEARLELKKAMKTPISEFIDHEEVKRLLK